MQTILKSCAVFILSILFFQCDENDAKCDASKHRDKKYEVTAPVNASVGGLTYETELAGNQRIFRWYRSTSFVCIYDLVEIDVAVKTFDVYLTSDFNIQVREQHNIPITTNEIPMVPEQRLLLGVAQINLLPSFVVGSGSFDVVVEISFPTTGNADQDVLYLLGKVVSVAIYTKYSEN